ncbi:MAG: hypothetical protein AWU59_2050 [Methanolobus sp. T82-4]|jgi:predicted transcriptional regulator|nr:MAG: hypothetical protein AWU59_2050 [Methanolobus sp. T82-4]
MKRDLLNVVFASNKRKDTLLLLKSKPQDMESLLSSLDTTRQSLIPQIRILEEHYLVKHHKNIYELTQLGKIMIANMVPLLDTIDTFSSDLGYWGNHILDFIPLHLLLRMKELGKCDIIVPPIQESHDVIKIFHESSKKSVTVYSINTFFHPNLEDLFEDLFQNNVEIHYILSQE